MDRANMMQIREAIASGTLTPEEVIERLSAAIEAEYGKATPDLDFINACEDLLWELGAHGQELSVPAADRYLAAVRKAARPSWASRALRCCIAAAVLALLLGLVGLPCAWFTHDSSVDEQQYVIQGHEITVEMVAKAIAEHQEITSLQTDDWDEFVDFLGFAPSVPNADALGMDEAQYVVACEPTHIACYILYRNSSDTTQTAIYTAKYCTAISNAYTLFEQNANGMHIQIGDTKAYVSENIEKPTFVWLDNTTVCRLSGSVEFNTGRKVVEELIGEKNK